MTPETLAALTEARVAKRPVVLATRLSDGAQRLLPDGHGLDVHAHQALHEDRSKTVQHGNETWFLHAYNPPLRLVVVGAVHIAQALVPLAVRLGYGVVVVDPRRAFASEERFPGVSVSTDWPDEAMDALGPDTRTAIVTLTHDPKLDDPALDRALKSEAFYIGALGIAAHACRTARSASDAGAWGRGAGAYPGAGGAEHRGGDGAGDRTFDPGADGRRAPRRAVIIPLATT